MLIGVQFRTYNTEGELYSSRFGFFGDLQSAKKAAIRLYHSSPSITRVEAYDAETERIIKRVPDGRGGTREGGGRRAFDGQTRHHRLTVRLADDVWQAMVEAGIEKSEYIHRALRLYIQQQKQD